MWKLKFWKLEIKIGNRNFEELIWEWKLGNYSQELEFWRIKKNRVFFIKKKIFENWIFENFNFDMWDKKIKRMGHDHCMPKVAMHGARPNNFFLGKPHLETNL